MSEMTIHTPETVYAEYKDRIAVYVRRRISNAEDAADLSSVTFEKVCASWKSFVPEKGDVSSWVYTIARNTVFDFLRKKKKERMDKPIDFSQAVVSSSPLTPEEQLLRNETLDKLYLALERLPQRERDIVILRFYHEKPLFEIAKKMKISYVNARYLNYRALNKMKRYLSAESI